MEVRNQCLDLVKFLIVGSQGLFGCETGNSILIIPVHLANRSLADDNFSIGFPGSIVIWVFLHHVIPEFSATKFTSSELFIFLFSQVTTHDVELRTWAAEYFTTDSTVVLPPEKFTKLAVALEAIRHIFVWDPLLLRANGRPYSLQHIWIHYVM